LPTTLDGEAGQLLADVQSTLHDLDDLVGQLATEALHDPLTGAPNRRAFERRLARELERVCHHGEQIALVALDVDGLKVVNDDWGHAAGDACLRHLTAATARHLDGHGWIARWGGDEFIAVVWEGPGTPQAEAILAGVAAELAANPVQLPNGVQVKLAVSGGISRARPGERPQELFTRADAELYRAKRGRSLLPQPESTNT
jgi:diguanylate cyclase (GGDEF)-like protein